MYSSIVKFSYFILQFLLLNTLPFCFLEGVKVLSEALVKSVTYQDDKLEIHLKDGRLVGSVIFAQVQYNSGNY